MENQRNNVTPLQARRGVDYINNMAVRLDNFSVEELEVLRSGCAARLNRARLELAVVEDVLEERRNPHDDMGLTL